MNLLLSVIIIVLLAAVIAVQLLGRRQKPDDSALAMQQQLDSLRRQLSESLKNNTDTVNTQLAAIIGQVNSQLNAVTGQMITSQKTMGERLDNAVSVVSQVQKGIGSLSEATERVFAVGKDIASLQEILRAPKLRGSLGELFLGDLLGQILPRAHFELQYKFKNGEAVDAIIRLGQGLVPVDSKFPLENFKRMIAYKDEAEYKAARKKFVSDVKKHIDSIAEKYILPDEGTFDFAFMYIPAENVYYETIIKDDRFDEAASISSYALSKKIIPASPNSFYAYLQAIVLGLRGMRIEKSAEAIIGHLARLKGDFEKFSAEFEVLGKHIVNMRNKYDDTAKRLDNFGGKLLASSGEETQETPAEKLLT